jgi:DNA gyrase subunit A
MSNKEKEKKAVDFENLLQKSKILSVKVEEEMKKSFIAYAMAVNVSRAIPDVRDGLKPVHRRILYAMGEDLKLYSDKPHRKCARIVGEVLGKYHPHGDSSVYDALVRLAQDFSIRYKLVDGHGNFGSVDGDPPAAQRYTEARLAPIASVLLQDIEKRTVDFYPNFDESEMQPVVLPARFPNLLVNGADGIAVGMATNIPPHNLREVIDGTIALIDNPEITIEELMTHIPAPDYPTGGILMGRAAVKHAYKTGRGGFILRGRAIIEEYNNNTRQRIVVTELPYQVNKARLIEAIADLVKDKKIEGISDVKEESDREGLRIVIEVKRDAQAQVVLNALYKHTQLQVSGGITFLALVNGEPKVLNLKDMLYHYVEHQKDVVVRRTKYDLEKAEEKAHILQGLITALENIDEVVHLIKASRDRIEATENLTKRFLLSEKQAQAILDMRLQRLTSLEVTKLKEEYEATMALISELKSILASGRKVLEIIKNELTAVKEKYGDDRKTELSYDYGEIDIADLIEKEDAVISMTHFGYIKRLAASEYKAQNRGGRGVTAHKTKEEDFLENMFICSTHDDLLFFTNKGKVYRIKAYEVPEAERHAKGRAIINLLQLSEGEKVTAVIPLNQNKKGFIMMATRKGLIKKTSLDEFENIRKVGKIAISLNENDELISVQLTVGYDEILIASRYGKCIRISEQDVRAMGRDTQGVRSMKLDGDDYIVDMTVLKNNCHILTVTENGYGKRTPLEDYRLQSRAGKGVKAGVFNEKTGWLVNLKLIAEDNDAMIISDSGTIIRIRAKDVSVFSRDTQGVRIMRIGEGEKVVSVAVTPSQEQEETIAAVNNE